MLKIAPRNNLEHLLTQDFGYKAFPTARAKTSLEHVQSTFLVLLPSSQSLYDGGIIAYFWLCNGASGPEIDDCCDLNGPSYRKTYWKRWAVQPPTSSMGFAIRWGYPRILPRRPDPAPIPGCGPDTRIRPRSMDLAPDRLPGPVPGPGAGHTEGAASLGKVSSLAVQSNDQAVAVRKAKKQK